MNRIALPFVFAALAFFAAPRLAHASGCREVSDIVGYEHCHRFGDGWATERRLPVSVSLDLPYLSFDPNGVGFSGSRSKSDTTSLSYPGQALGVRSLQTFGFGMRIEGFLLGPLYTGINWEIGFGHNQVGAVRGSADTTSVWLNGSDAAVNTTSVQGGALLGVRIPLGRVSLRLEMLAGGEAFMLSQHSAIGDYTMSAGRGVLEPRGIFDIWATPNVTMSFYGGVDTLDTDNRSFGVLIGFHGRSFDGAFAWW